MHRRATAVSAAISSVLLVTACKHDVAERCEAFPVFFSVETRDYHVVGREEPGGRRWYTLEDKAGHVVAPCIPERAVRDRYPDAAAALERVKRTWKTPQLGHDLRWPSEGRHRRPVGEAADERVGTPRGTAVRRTPQ